MGLKNILVHQDQTKASRARLELAVFLSKQHDAHLKVIFARGGWRQSISEHAREAKREFDELAADINAEWIEGDAYNPDKNLIDQLTWHARHSDLLILGQYNETDHGFAPANLVETMMLTCGRPVLIVPHIWRFKELGQEIMVAWDRNRESVRAVNDAIPFLKRARRVHLVAVTSKKPAPEKKFDRCQDLATHLSYHGIEAETNNLVARDIDITNLLLSVLTDGHIDLMVMGGYGHARVREMVLGGVTRDILKQMPVPVLMSH